jgi:hypothetical protein
VPLVAHCGGERAESRRALHAPLALNDQSLQLELIQPLTGTSTHRDWL